MPLLEVEHLQKVYTARFGAVQVEALRDVNFTVEEGEYVAIMGESGSGKTTLLNILAALDKPTSGAVRLSGGDITKIKDSKMSQFRREHLGFVFQDFNLLDTFSLRDNIFLPLVLSHKGHAEMAARLAPIARQLGIEALLDKYPYEVSGGQKQRAAVARALITKPEIVLADEVLDLTVTLYYTAFCDVDVIARSVRVTNHAKEPVYLTKVFSAALDLDAEDYRMLTLHGSWARERQIEYRQIGYGKQSPAPRVYNPTLTEVRR